MPLFFFVGKRHRNGPGRRKSRFSCGQGNVQRRAHHRVGTSDGSLQSSRPRDGSENQCRDLEYSISTSKPPLPQWNYGCPQPPQRLARPNATKHFASYLACVGTPSEQSNDLLHFDNRCALTSLRCAGKTTCTNRTNPNLWVKS